MSAISPSPWQKLHLFKFNRVLPKVWRAYLIKILNFSTLHTYIIGHYNPSVRILTPLMLCVLILYISGGTYCLKSTSNDKFFEKLFMAIPIYSQSFCQKSAERKSPKKYFSYFILIFGLGLEPGDFILIPFESQAMGTLAFRLIRQHTTY